MHTARAARGAAISRIAFEYSSFREINTWKVLELRVQRGF